MPNQSMDHPNQIQPKHWKFTLGIISSRENYVLKPQTPTFHIFLPTQALYTIHFAKGKDWPTIGHVPCIKIDAKSSYHKALPWILCFSSHWWDCNFHSGTFFFYLYCIHCRPSLGFPSIYQFQIQSVISGYYSWCNKGFWFKNIFR